MSLIFARKLFRLLHTLFWPTLVKNVCFLSFRGKFYVLHIFSLAVCSLALLKMGIICTFFFMNKIHAITYIQLGMYMIEFGMHSCRLFQIFELGREKKAAQNRVMVHQHEINEM